MLGILVPDKPSKIEIIKLYEDGFDVMWSPVRGADFFQIQILKEKSALTNIEGDGNMTSTSTRVSRLTPGGIYEIRVKAYNNHVGAGPQSSVSSSTGN